MYFAIVGKNTELAGHEFKSWQIETLEEYNSKGISRVNNQFQIVYFSNYPENIHKLATIIKFGEIINIDEYQLNVSTNQKILLGTNSEKVIKKLSSKYKFRYKILDLIKSDLEIKQKGQEILELEKNLFGIVMGYQNIKLYETIDFGKPDRSMKIGMMPSKLTHILCSIGVGIFYNINPPNINGITIYDPFVGTGTTGLLANALGYNFIGSDINIKLAEHNLLRRKTQNLYQDNAKFMLFKHNIMDLWQKNFLRHTNVIITEGWLGPIIRRNTSTHELITYQDQIWKIYCHFLENIKKFFTQNLIVIFTFPHYIVGEAILEKRFAEYLTANFTDFEILECAYQRPSQLIARKIVIIKVLP